MSDNNRDRSAQFINVNGREVEVFPAGSENAPKLADEAKFIIAKFSKFVDYDTKQDLSREGLEVNENLGNNMYICKYKKREEKRETSAPMFQPLTHLALYPNPVVPEVRMASNSKKSADGDESGGEKLPFVIQLHSTPTQTPIDILALVCDRYHADPIDDKFTADVLRVNLDPELVAEVSKIDSVRSVTKIEPRRLFSLRQRAIMNFPPATGGAAMASVSYNSFNGADEIVHVADSGFDKGEDNDVHAAFAGRVLACVSLLKDVPKADKMGHGTHVAGSVLGNLTNLSEEDAKGTAPDAKLVSLAMIPPKGHLHSPSTYNILTHEVQDLGPPTIVNNSWGVGFCFDNGPRKYGPNDASIVDHVMWKNPNVCLLFAAGNDGTYVDRDYEHFNNTLARKPQIGDYASAKNCITVGATYSDRPLDQSKSSYDKSSNLKCHKFELTDFSSTGPTLEGRVKPDVVAPGAIVLSARSRAITPENLARLLEYNGQPDSEQLIYMSGTSMATPAVTGCVAVLRSAFRTQQQKTPTGALLKALIIHGADDMEGTEFTVKSVVMVQKDDKEVYKKIDEKLYKMTAAPNGFQGYGLVNILNSLLPIEYPPNVKTHGYIDERMKSGTHKVKTLEISNSAKNLVVTMAYTDKKGEQLQNNIKLWIELANEERLTPCEPTDPLGRESPSGDRGVEKTSWQPSNVAKIVKSNPYPGEATIHINIETIDQVAPFALVWSII